MLLRRRRRRGFFFLIVIIVVVCRGISWHGGRWSVHVDVSLVMASWTSLLAGRVLCVVMRIVLVLVGNGKVF
jgi:hypothetical protein